MQYYQVIEQYGPKNWVVIASSMSPCAAKKQMNDEIRIRRLNNQIFNRLMWIRSKFSGETFNAGQGIVTSRTYTTEELDQHVEFSWV